jgi:hypothetical protein
LKKERPEGWCASIPLSFKTFETFAQLFSYKTNYAYPANPQPLTFLSEISLNRFSIYPPMPPRFSALMSPVPLAHYRGEWDCEVEANSGQR